MIARITIIIALLSIANCVGKRTIEFRVEKKYGFLHIFKYIGYNLYVKEGDSAEGTDPKKCTSNWYFWSGYQEKFKDGTYKISLITQVNAEEEKAPIEVQLEAVNDLTLLAKNVPIDSRCTVSKEFDYKIEDKGWTKNVKNLKVLLTCKADKENESQEQKPKSENAALNKNELPEEKIVEDAQDDVQVENEVEAKKLSVKPASKVVLEQPVEEQQQVVLEQPVEELNQPVVEKNSKVLQEERIIL